MEELFPHLQIFLYTQGPTRFNLKNASDQIKTNIFSLAHWCYYFLGKTKAGSLKEFMKYDRIIFKMKKAVDIIMAYFQGRFRTKIVKEEIREAKGCEDLEMSDGEQYGRFNVCRASQKRLLTSV